jgi:hypothetical protein
VSEGLTFNIAQLIMEPIGATRIGEVSADLLQVAPDLKQVEGAPLTPLTGSVRLMNTSNGILVQGDLHAVATLPCARCLEPVSAPIDFKLEEVFVPTIEIATGQALTPEEEDRALDRRASHSRFARGIRQYVLVATPYLLPGRLLAVFPIGQNLNGRACGCKPRWIMLECVSKHLN